MNSQSDKLAVYGPGSAVSWSAGWRFLGFAESIESALAQWPEAISILRHAGEPNQQTVWTAKSGTIDQAA